MENHSNELETKKQPTRIPTFYHGVRIECAVGDISRQPDMAAIANAATIPGLTNGGGTDAVDRVAGPGLAGECRLLFPLEPGEALLTGAHGLPNRQVIHCRCPIYGLDEPAAELLADCYRNALRLADEHGIESIAIPAFSVGASGHPFIEATEIACRTILQTVPSLTSVKRIRLVFTSAKSANIACTLLNQRFDQ